MDQTVGAPRKRANKHGTDLRREQLAQAALDLIGSHGLKGLSIGAVAQRVGIVPSGVYKHFRDRAALVDAALDLIGDRLVGNVGLVCDEADDPVECLQRLAERHVELMQLSQGIPRVAFSDDVYLGRPDRKVKVYGFVRRYLDALADLVRKGQASGRLRPELDPDTVAVLFLGLVQPVGILWHLSDGTFDAKTRLEDAWRIFASDVLREPTKRPVGRAKGDKR